MASIARGQSLFALQLEVLAIDKDASRTRDSPQALRTLVSVWLSLKLVSSRNESSDMKVRPGKNARLSGAAIDLRSCPHRSAAYQVLYI